MSPLPFVQVMLIKTTFLDLKMLGDMPSIKDLPISPLSSTVTGLCSMPPRSQDGGSYFILSHKTYNAITKLFVGKKLMQIIASDIEWTYPFVERDTTDEGSKYRPRFADAVSVVVNNKGKGREKDIEKLMDSHEEKS
ncbi:1752_t:CDS:2, partial [Entrophospora sp. SA101]